MYDFSSMLATSSADGTVKLWYTNELEPLHETRINNSNSIWTWDLAFSNNSTYLYSVSSDKQARRWSTDNFSLDKEFTGHQKPIICLAYADGRT
jgi:G protein beta subunit-like protein